MKLKKIIGILAVGLPLTLMCCKEWQIKKYGDRIVGDWIAEPCFLCSRPTYVFTEDGSFMIYLEKSGKSEPCGKDTLVNGPYHYHIEDDRLIIDGRGTWTITKLTKSDFYYKYNGNEAKFHRCD